MKYALFFIVYTFSFLFVSSQENSLITSNISSELKINANAVIRDSKTEISVLSIDKMIVKQKETITVFNDNGDKVVKAYTHYNNDTKINQLSLKVFDAFGKELKKISKSNFIDVSAVDGATLYSDARVKYYDYTPTSYPYTVVLDKEYKTSTTGFIPPWNPIYSYSISVERSEYKLNNPNNFKARVKEQNFKGFSINRISENEIHYLMENQPAIKYESSSPYFIDIRPNVLVALNDFSLKGVDGNATDWKTFGKWINDKLLVGRSHLNASTIAKAKDLVKGIESDVEKAKILYEYVQNKMRYISVQVGIGGWEPISASEVDAMNYGDCKGLTNYTKALLEAVGITSYYTIVYAKNRRDIDSSFSSLQGNHVILNIPNKGDDIWLECTSKTLPFGFLGNFTDNRNVLVITPEGGVIKKTPQYKDETNLQTTKTSIILDSLGNVNAYIERNSRGIQYDNKYYIENYTNKDIKEYYVTKDWSYLNNLKINTVEITNNKDDIVFTEHINTSISNYASINEDEYTFKLNIFNRNNYIPRRYRKRSLPLKIERGYKDIDEYTIQIPKGYSIEGVDKNEEIETVFGTYSLSLKKTDEDKIHYKKEILIKSGTYPKEDYEAYRTFRRKIAKLENLNLTLKKNTI